MPRHQRNATEPGQQNFGDPASVIKYAPTTGVFASDEFLGDREGFAVRVISKWYNIPGNTLPVESSEHLARAESLFPLYETIRANGDRLYGKLGGILGCMNQTGSVSEAKKLLDAALAQT
jgi:hypothetical protein